MLTPHALAATQAAQEKHFIRRAKERFGVDLSPTRYRSMLRKLENQEGEVKFIQHQPPNRTVWVMRVAGRMMRVVYDHTTERLVTALPSHEDANERRERPQPNRFRVRRLREEGVL